MSNFSGLSNKIDLSKDYYQILGLKKDAKIEDIKAAHVVLGKWTRI